MKKIKIGAVLLAFAICLGLAPMVMAQAGSLEILDMVQTEKRVEARVEPSDSAEVGKVYEPGDYLLIVEGGNASWHAVAYQGNVYYVKKANAVEAKEPVVEVEDKEDGTIKEVVMDETFQEELDEEMEIEKHESKAFVEEYERYREESKQKKIWGAVIAVLIAAVFGVSIYSHVSGKKKNGKKDKK